MSSIKAAKEAAAKVNALLVASGQLKLSEIEKQNKSGNLYVEEVVINDAPMSARNYLTRSSTQEEISKMSGASVSTKGRYLTAEELKNNFFDKPLHLQIQGVNQQDVKVAVGRIMHLIMEHTTHKKNSHSKGRSQKSYSQNDQQSSRHNSTEEIQGLPLQTQMYREKVYLPHTVGLNSVEIRIKLVGENATNFRYIEEETGVNVVLRGIGSGYLEPETGQESPEQLHFYLEHSNQERFEEAKQYVVNLSQTILLEMQETQQQLLASSIPGVQQVAANVNLQQSVQPTVQAIPAQAVAGVQQNVQATVLNSIQGNFPALQQPVATPYDVSLITNATQPAAFPTTQVYQNQIVQSVAQMQPQVLTTVSGAQQVNMAPNIVLSSVPNAVPEMMPITLSVPTTEVVQVPQLVQVSHGAQIIGTADGPRLIAVVSNAPSVMSEPTVTTVATPQNPIPITYPLQASTETTYPPATTVETYGPPLISESYPTPQTAGNYAHATPVERENDLYKYQQEFHQPDFESVNQNQELISRDQENKWSANSAATQFTGPESNNSSPSMCPPPQLPWSRYSNPNQKDDGYYKREEWPQDRHGDGRNFVKQSEFEPRAKRSYSSRGSMHASDERGESTGFSYSLYGLNQNNRGPSLQNQQMRNTYRRRDGIDSVGNDSSRSTHFAPIEYNHSMRPTIVRPQRDSFRPARNF